MAVPLSATTGLDQFYTAEEFMALSLDPGKRYELVRGVLKEMSWPGGEHMLVAENLQFALGSFVRANKLGRVLGPGSFKLKIPDAIRDTVRSPDLTFVRTADIAKLDSGAVNFPPDLSVEIYSKNDRPGDLREKLEDYQAAGWDGVWVIYPPQSAPKKKAGTVEIYRLQQNAKPLQTLTVADQLSDEDVIPGFSVAVAQLFEYD